MFKLVRIHVALDDVRVNVNFNSGFIDKQLCFMGQFKSGRREAGLLHYILQILNAKILREG